MRLLLDAHVSGRRIGSALRRRGHDVLALDSDAALARLPDGEVLVLAASEERIVVARNVSDLARLVRERPEAGHRHAGMILIPVPVGSEAVMRRLQEIFAARPDQAEWIDRGRLPRARVMLATPSSGDCRRAPSRAGRVRSTASEAGGLATGVVRVRLVQLRT